METNSIETASLMAGVEQVADAIVITNNDAARPPGMSLSGRRILTVDSDVSSRALLLEVLQQWNCDAVAVAAPGAALMRLESEAPADAILESEAPYDAILISLDLPFMRGDRLAGLISGNPRWNPIPLVLMSPMGDQESGDHWIIAGFSERVNKPVKQGELRTCLVSVIGYRPAPDFSPRPQFVAYF